MYFLTNLIECLNNGDLQNWKNFLLLAGVFYFCKLSLKIIYNLYSGLKTFVLPMIWPRNFPVEYGPWAGESLIRSAEF